MRMMVKGRTRVRTRVRATIRVGNYSRFRVGVRVGVIVDVWRPLKCSSLRGPLGTPAECIRQPVAKVIGLALGLGLRLRLRLGSLSEFGFRSGI